MKDLRLKNYEDNFLKVSDKISNVFATEDQIFDLSIQKFDSFMDCKKKICLLNLIITPILICNLKETALIIKNYLKNLKK